MNVKSDKVESDFLNEISLEFNSPVPLYYQLMQEISRLLLEGAIKPGDRLPTEMELIEALGVSRGTITRAMMSLAEEGILKRERSKGTFVSDLSLEKSNALFSGAIQISQSIKASGMQPSVKNLQCTSIPPPEIIRDLLKIKPNAKLTTIHRLYYADDKPFALNWYFLAPDAQIKIDMEKLGSGSLYEYLIQEHHLKILFGKRIVGCMSSDQKTADALGISPKDPILTVSGIDLDNKEHPIGAMVSFFKSNAVITMKVQQMNQKNWWMSITDE